MSQICQMTDNLVEDNPTLKDRYLNEAEWHEIEITIVMLLEPMAKVTPILSS
ncbi:14341_t:CDS:2, partial [Dentiscutata erythropus]